MSDKPLTSPGDKPKKLKILGYHYDVVEDGDSSSIDAFGRYHAAKQEIQVARNLKDEGKATTVLHEIIEALNYHLDLKLDHNVIMSLEAGLYQALADNGVSLDALSGYIQKK